jgi:hypothetical protein
MKIKDVIIAYCRDSKCPVQESIDSHRANQGSEEEIRLIKYSHCVRCDVWRLRKWLEGHGLKIELDEDNETPGKYF